MGSVTAKTPADATLRPVFASALLAGSDLIATNSVQLVAMVTDVSLCAVA